MITPDALGPYLDPAAMLIVAGGTFAATVLRTPLRDIGRGIAALATLPRRTLDATPLIDQAAALGRIAKRHGVHTLDRSVIADKDVAAAIAAITATPTNAQRIIRPLFDMGTPFQVSAYDKPAASCLAFVKLASIRIWLRAGESAP